MTFLEHFGFIEQPFGVTPDPRFLHLGPKHREALASLVRATEENRGFVALIAPPGMGKTTLLFQYLESLRHTARTAFLFQNAQDASELMQYVLAELGLSPRSRDSFEMNQTLNEMLREEMQAGRRFVLVIDEAQHLSPEVLESVRLLSNFETPWAKLMQIVLAGQPQLAEILARPSMAQLRQRVSSIAHLEPFTAEETNHYIDHRLWVAGRVAPDLYTLGARTLIAKHSEGIPRNINNLCYQSLVIAHAAGAAQVKADMVREVISDLAIESLAPKIEASGHFQSAMPISAWKASRSAAAPQLGAPLRSLSGRSGRTSRAVVSISALLFLSIVSGVLWKVHAHPQPLGVTPNVEAAAFPARVTALAPASETMFPPSARLPLSPSAVDGPNSLADHGPDDLAQNGRVSTVVVEPGMTIRHISLEYLGRFDPAEVAAILSLNPQIKDPDHIETGEQIRLPLSRHRGSDTNATPQRTQPGEEGAR
ncbi:MAG: AAA family ATPase [Candidatus Acidiferrales bacterium]